MKTDVSRFSLGLERRIYMSFKKGKEIIEYRNYYLPSHFPLVFLSGPKWKISDIPSERLHFHNCLEIGICHSGSGTLRFCNGQEIHFFAGDITCIPRNTPHTTFSDPGTNSRWSYLFFDLRQLFIDLLQPNSPLFFLQQDVKSTSYLLNLPPIFPFWHRPPFRSFLFLRPILF